LAARLDRFRSLALLHDGLAAASVYAGRPRTAVLTLGTSIGVGYVPPARGLRPYFHPWQYGNPYLHLDPFVEILGILPEGNDDAMGPI
jgi:hypothetical protein